MRQRLPIVLSATALVVALMAMTPLGEAASSQLRATFATNAGKLRGFAPSKAARKNTVVVRGANGKIGAASLPLLRGPRGPAGPAGATGPAGPAGATGPAGAPNPNAVNAQNADALDNLDSTAFQSRVRWALVDSTGTILAQSGGISVASSGGGANYLNFGSSVANTAVMATVQWVTGTNGGNGEITAAPCGGPGAAPGSVTCVILGTNNLNHLYVETSSAAGAQTAKGFFVALIG
jgi:hypothetical protein